MAVQFHFLFTQTPSLPSQKKSVERAVKPDSVHKNSIVGGLIFSLIEMMSFLFILLSNLYVKAFQLVRTFVIIIII